MEEAIRKELTALCHEIIADKQNLDLDDLIDRSEMLQEKLVLLKYFRQRERRLYKQSPRAAREKDYDQEIEETLKAAEASRKEPPKGSSSAAPITPQPGEEAEEKEFSAVSKQSGVTEEKPEPVTEKAPVHNKAEETPAPAPLPKSEEKPKAPQASADETNESPVETEKLKADKPPQEAAQAPQRERVQPLEKQQRSINERFVGGNIQLGLNDRLAFMKHLFGGSQEDLIRVVSQLNTFSTYSEAANFLEQMVKPDYQWEDKEEYEERFMFLVRQRFGEE